MRKRDIRTRFGSRGILYSVVPGFVFLLLIAVEFDAPLDVEERVALVELSELNAVQIDTVYGSRRVYTDLEYNYRVRVRDGATWPIRYHWTIDEDLRTTGNNIVHQFKRPGKYPIDVVVSNEYGEDEARIWVYAVDRTIVRPPVTQLKSPQEAKETATDIDPVSVKLLPSNTPVEGTYYSWVIETYLSPVSARSAMNQYVKLGLPHVRVYEDDSGSGATAFRILVGKYDTQRLAVSKKVQIESAVERPLSLITIRG